MSDNFKTKYKLRLNKERIEHPVRYRIMKWFLILLIVLLILFILLFIVVFVVFPIVFKYTISLQRSLIFINIEVPKNPKFHTPHDYGFQGIQNFYITSTVDMKNPDLLSIGAWWIPHEKYKNSTESMDVILAKNEFPVILYNHGVAATRILKWQSVYDTLRKFFHVIAIDYRNFGDSTPCDLTEDGVITDVIRTYNLMKTKTIREIYVWGHSLGGGISTHAIRWLKENQDEVPAGYVIESSFTCLQDEIYEFALAKIFRWLPWFEFCVVDPIRENGFIFNTTENLEYVDCPVMIMHAEDDPVIPFYLGQKNYEITSKNRKTNQGKVSFHPFPADKGYGHNKITEDPNVPKFIAEFMQECQVWKIKREKKPIKLIKQNYS